MKVINTIAELQRELIVERRHGHSIGFVPTMGALHKGHASLVARSVRDNDVTVVSIFLNPTQFNDKRDLEKYPRTVEADCRLLSGLGATIAFTPSVDEMYPEPDTRTFSYPPTDTVMEGEHRPGHFNGVCQIVSKLFDAVCPSCAYFGEKDYQQIAVIRRMVADLKYNIDIIACPVVREPSGLAMSSRNTLLTDQERDIAANIYRILAESRKHISSLTVGQVRQYVIDAIDAIDGLTVEYYSIVDAASLAEVSTWASASHIVGCITVFCGKTPIRLIDHIKYF